MRLRTLSASTSALNVRVYDAYSTPPLREVSVVSGYQDQTVRLSQRRKARKERQGLKLEIPCAFCFSARGVGYESGDPFQGNMV